MTAECSILIINLLREYNAYLDWLFPTFVVCCIEREGIRAFAERVEISERGQLSGRPIKRNFFGTKRSTETRDSRSKAVPSG